MPKGGYRPGAGRKKGDCLPEKRNRLPYLLDEKLKKRLRELTPLSAMIDIMLKHIEAAERMEEVKQESVMVDGKTVSRLAILRAAAKIAADAAPYVHKKKPVEVEHTGPNGGAINHHVTVEIVDGEAPAFQA